MGSTLHVRFNVPRSKLRIVLMRFTKDRKTLNLEPVGPLPAFVLLSVRSPGRTIHLWRPAPATGAAWLTRANRSARSRPHCQHSENCPSISSPQPAQAHGFFTGSNGARVFLRIALASANRLRRLARPRADPAFDGRQLSRPCNQIELAGYAVNLV